MIGVFGILRRVGMRALGNYTPPIITWILATGFWNDSGNWVDSDTWID